MLNKIGSKYSILLIQGGISFITESKRWEIFEEILFLFHLLGIVSGTICIENS